jgi:sulfur-carrier protein adenylyltransferase/sulfurtransferase
MNKELLNDLELKRYATQIQINSNGEHGQISLKNSKVLVAGITSISSVVLQYLTMAGIGTLGICESNLVTESNFIHHTLFDLNDLGKLKKIASKEKLSLKTLLSILD